MAPHTIQVLVVEDSAEDRFFMHRALEQVQHFHCVHTAQDGQEAIHYLGGAEKYADRQLYPEPDVMFLDLKMPGWDGFEVLKWLQGRQKRPRVLVLTDSALAPDRDKAFLLGAEWFQTKPATLSGLVELLKMLEKAMVPTDASVIPVILRSNPVKKAV